MKTKAKKKRAHAKLARRQARMTALEARPTKTADEVFVSNGKKFHHTWCDSMNGVWLSGSNAIKAIHRHEALARGLERCAMCESRVHFEMH